MALTLRLPVFIVVVATALSSLEPTAVAAGLDERGKAILKQATRFFKQGMYDEAAKMLSDLSVDHPEMASLQRNLGACYYYMRRPEPALSNLRDYLAHTKRTITADDKAEVERWIDEMEKLRAQNAAAPVASPPAADTPQAPPQPGVVAPVVTAGVPAAAAPTGPAPTGPAATGSAPTGPAPSGPAPTSPAPTGLAPIGPAPTGPAPAGLTPTSPAPTGPAVGSALSPQVAEQPPAQIFPSLPPGEPVPLPPSLPAPVVDQFPQAQPPMAPIPFVPPQPSSAGYPPYVAPASPPVGVSARVDEEPGWSGLRITGTVLAAGGIAMVGLGGYFTWQTKSIESSISSSAAFDVNKYRDGQTAETMQWVCYGIGAGAMVTGVVLYVIGGSSSPRVSVAPQFRPGTVGLGAQGVF
jgi:hypothetical protein